MDYNICIDIDYSYPHISINGQSMTEMENYLHEYLLTINCTNEERRKIVDTEITESLKYFCKKCKIGYRDTLSNDTLSGVPICNFYDKAEEKIKCFLWHGRQFKNQKEMINIINLNNLGIKSSGGQSIGGKQRKQALARISQYMDFAPVKGKKQRQEIKEIYDVPHLIEIEDGRGKSGFFIDRLIPVMLSYFSMITQMEIFTNVDELSKIAGIVNHNFKNTQFADDLFKIDSRLTYHMIQQFYYRCKPEQEKIIYSVLNKLQDDYSVINYYRNYCIFTEKGSHTSSQTEDVIIQKAQQDVLKEFGVKRITTIFQRKLQHKFYNRVIELVNESYGYDWLSYRKQIQICISDLDSFLESTGILLNVDGNKISEKRNEVSQRFVQKIWKKTVDDFERTNKKADEIEAEWRESIKNNPELQKQYFNDSDIQDYIDCGCDYSELIPINKMEKQPFKYHENYLDVQNQLISIFLIPSDTEISLSKDDTKEIDSLFLD